MSRLQMVRKRAGWLVVLFLGEMLTATAMGFFEKEIARAVVLALFVPLIISSGGNSGSHASTLVGCGLPFILRRFGFDPATSSAPFVATLVDVTGLIIYFSVGLVVLRGTLL